MYFVVYILNAKRYVVVPYTWVDGLQNHLELFLNNGINSNKKHKVFYTDNPRAFANGLPLLNFIPNNGVGFSTRFPEEGWYICFVKKIKCRYLLGNLFIEYIFKFL